MLVNYDSISDLIGSNSFNIITANKRDSEPAAIRHMTSSQYEIDYEEPFDGVSVEPDGDVEDPLDD